MAHCIFFKKNQIKIRKSREINVFSTISYNFLRPRDIEYNTNQFACQMCEERIDAKIGEKFWQVSNQDSALCKALFRVQTLAVCGIFSLGISLSHLSTALKLVCVLFTLCHNTIYHFPFFSYIIIIMYCNDYCRGKSK